MATVGRNIAGPLLFLNLIMYIVVVGFASWCLNKYINFSTRHPGLGGNGATPFFLILAILSGVIGVISKLAGASHIRVWRNDSLAAAGSSSLVAWALTALAMGWYGSGRLWANVQRTGRNINVLGMQGDQHRRMERVETEGA